MKTRIITRHCEISTSLEHRANELLNKLDRFDPRITETVVTFDEQKRIRRVDAMVKVRGDEPVVAHAEAEDFREALDTLADRLTKILRRRRSQLVSRKGPKFSEAVANPE
jgi:ribosomal subunit interface protein